MITISVGVYPLVNVYITMENHHVNGYIHELNHHFQVRKLFVYQAG